jgi:hypothetical protein
MVSTPDVYRPLADFQQVYQAYGISIMNQLTTTLYSSHRAGSRNKQF